MREQSAAGEIRLQDWALSTTRAHVLLAFPTEMLIKGLKRVKSRGTIIGATSTRKSLREWRPRAAFSLVDIIASVSKWRSL